MQAAVQHMPPQMLPQYSLNRSAPGTHTTAVHTPPVATRKRKRVQHYTVAYSEVQEIDSAGRLRDVIVIEDTPPPSTVSPATTHMLSASYQPPIYSAPIRTRARAAAEAQASSSSASSALLPPPPAKRRKRDPVDVVGTPAKRPTVNGHLHATSTHKPWATGSGTATEDVRPSIPLLTTPTSMTHVHIRYPRVPCHAMIKRDITSSCPTISSSSDVRSKVATFRSRLLTSIPRPYCPSIGPGNFW